MEGCCGYRGLGLLPIALLVVTSGCFITTYVMSATSGHVSFEFPYISDTGAEPPESCIFTFFLSISAFLAAVIVFLRYRHILEYNQEDTQKVLRLNRISFYIGMVSPLGMLLVASFQDVNVFAVHIMGAAMAFVAGCIYAWIHTVITYRMNTNSAWMVDIRFFLSVLSTAALLVAAIYAEIALVDLQHKFNSKTALHWKPSDGGYPSHIVSTIAEWVVGLSFLLFFLTFSGDLSRLSLDLRLRLLLQDPLQVSGTVYTGHRHSTNGITGEREPLLASTRVEGPLDQSATW